MRKARSATAVAVGAVLLLLVVSADPLPSHDPDPSIPFSSATARLGRLSYEPSSRSQAPPSIPPPILDTFVPPPTVRPTLSPTPAPVPKSSASTPHVVRKTSIAHGWATWYRWHQGEAAAGPALRRALGRGWRGTIVRVCVTGACVKVRLTDWCACGSRHGQPTVIDLDRRSFIQLMPASRGVIRVTVYRP